MSAARGPLKQDDGLQCAKTILAVLVACVSLTVGAIAHAQSSTREYAFDIPQMAITPALREFSRRTGLQFGYFPDTPEEEDQLVGPLKGRYTIEAGLTELLKP